MATIDHVTLRVRDLGKSLEFYSRVFELLSFDGERYDGDSFHEWNDFSIAQADDEHPPTHGVHIGFVATSRAQVDDWWNGLTDAGYESDGGPGPRLEYGPDYYGAFIVDSDGNSIEAVHHRTATPRRRSDRPPLDPRARARCRQALLRRNRPGRRPPGP